MTSPMLRERLRAGRRGIGLRGERRFTFLLLVASCALSFLVAAAAPADPSSLEGVYDDGDLDRVLAHVGLQADACGASGSVALVRDSSLCPLAPGNTAPLPRATPPPVKGRSPPRH